MLFLRLKIACFVSYCTVGGKVFGFVLVRFSLRFMLRLVKSVTLTINKECEFDGIKATCGNFDY